VVEVEQVAEGDPASASSELPHARCHARSSRSAKFGHSQRPLPGRPKVLLKSAIGEATTGYCTNRQFGKPHRAGLSVVRIKAMAPWRSHGAPNQTRHRPARERIL